MGNSDYVFHNYGIISSNLENFGALPTHSYATMLKDIEKYSGKLVIGGGEVLFSEWETLFGFISGTYSRLNANKLFSKIERRLQIAKRTLGGQKVSLPFSPHPEELNKSDLNIYYSSVGGQFYGDLKWKKNKDALHAMEAAKYISVRDQRSKDSLNAAGLNAKLVPDSALIMSDYFSLENLIKESKVSPEIYREPCMFVQLGRFKGPDDLSLFGQKLKTISKALQLKVVLCPIGIAPGHEDDIILKELASRNDDFVFVMPASISDIMLLIAQSQFYLGTSLHGLITAQSFNVPHLPLNKKITKAVSYLNTWVDDSLRAADFTDDFYVIDTFKKWKTEKINKNTDLQKEMVRNNLKYILQD